MKTITTEERRNMSHQEGLILQGCGGDLQEWIDGIIGILREQRIFLGIASRTLKENGMHEQAEKMRQRITGGECHSYEEALMIIADYVNITSAEPEEGMKMDFS